MVGERLYVAATPVPIRVAPFGPTGVPPVSVRSRGASLGRVQALVWPSSRVGENQAMAPSCAQVRRHPASKAAPEPPSVAHQAPAAPAMVRPSLKRPLGRPSAVRRDTRRSPLAPEVALVARALDSASGTPYAPFPRVPRIHVGPVTDPVRRAPLEILRHEEVAATEAGSPRPSGMRRARA